MNSESSKIRFIKSSTGYKDCPESSLPEYAFVGRSNVGKSSLINLITDRKKLAKISSLPGKTRLINHFLINDSWFLVDLPGYGYARVTKTERGKFILLIQNYLLYRKNLACLFLLIDCRLEPQINDLQFIRWLGENEIPFALCFTKTDKISKNKLESAFARYKNKLLEEWASLPPVFFTSTFSKNGRKEILEYISTTNVSLPAGRF
jgi:GTP-binding protein